MPKFKRIPQRNKEPEKVIGHLRATQANVFSNILTDTEVSIAPNDLVAIGKCVRTAGNVPRYRLFGTINWVSEIDGFVDVDGIKSNVSEVLEEKVNNRLNLFTNSDTNKITGKKAKVANKSVDLVTKNINNNFSTGKSKHMDKTQLRNVFATLTTGQTLEINFGGARSHLSGAYRVERLRTGRGKGGSRLLDLVRLSDGQVVTTGTPDSTNIVNLVVDGMRHGLENASDLPVVYGRNKLMNKEFKVVAKSILELRKRDSSASPRITVDSSIPEFSGTFDVVGAQRGRGRGGPCRLDLTEVGTGRALTLWSSRHSGAIRSIALATS